MRREEICFRGYLDQNWSDRLGGLDLTHASDGNNILSGVIQDQSALHGLLFQLSNLGVALISVSSGILYTGSKAKEVKA